MSKLGKWSTTPGSNNSTPPDGWPEGQAPSTVNDCAREMMASIRTVFQDAQWFDQDFTPTYVNATSFTVAGDQTSAIHAGRRLKLYDATAGVATVIYATVLTASFTAVTTISVSADGGQLTSSLSSFAIAILSNTNTSLPRNPSADRFSTSALEVTGTFTAGGMNAANLQLADTLTVSGATVLKGALSVGGAVNLEGAVALGTTLSVSGAAVIKGVLSVGGAVNLNGATALFTTLTVGGATALLGTLSVSGTVVAANVSKAWGVFFLSAGGLANGASFNIASISRSAVGIVKFTFQTAFVDATYCPVISTYGGGTITSPSNLSRAAATCKFTVRDQANNPVDEVFFAMAFYR